MKNNPQAAGTGDSLVPFGKYKGQPLELMLADQDYLQWVTSQPGLMTMLQSRHPAVFNIITVGAPANSDTPEHNALQARFLAQDFQYAFIELRTGKSVYAASSEVAAAVNEAAQKGLQAAQALSAEDYAKSALELQEAREEHAKTAQEDGRKHYEQERADYNARETKRYEREVASAVERYRRPEAIPLPGKFIDYERWLDGSGTWSWTVKNRQENLAKATARAEADQKALRGIASFKLVLAAPKRPGVLLDFECGYDVDFRVYWSQGVNIPEETDGGSYLHYRPRAWREGCARDARDRRFGIELKPQMGDDFPAVLRQMKRNEADTLVIGSFEATTCTLEQVRAMFGKKRIITLEEIEAVRRRGVWPEETDETLAEAFEKLALQVVKEGRA